MRESVADAVYVAIKPIVKVLDTVFYLDQLLPGGVPVFYEFSSSLNNRWTWRLTRLPHGRVQCVGNIATNLDNELTSRGLPFLTLIAYGFLQFIAVLCCFGQLLFGRLKLLPRKRKAVLGRLGCSFLLIKLRAINIRH